MSKVRKATRRKGWAKQDLGGRVCFKPIKEGITQRGSRVIFNDSAQRSNIVRMWAKEGGPMG
jgi:hypothetical protein